MLAEIKRQRLERIYRFVVKYWLEKRYAPSLREIQEGCEVSSTSVVNVDLDYLKRQGLVDFEEGQPRTLTVTGVSVELDGGVWGVVFGGLPLFLNGLDEKSAEMVKV